MSTSMRPRNLNSGLLNLLLLTYSVILGIQPAMADVVLPSINDKYIEIHEVNPTRDAGFVVGDVLERTITL
ncbi:MAG: hypothetical protein Q8L73_11680, partial [Methylotenera sp.]|nr:hypothetical protein [Methylotenera sp.]